MQCAALIDLNSGEFWSLDEFVRKHGEVTIGRVGCGSTIEIGNLYSSAPRRKTAEQKQAAIDSLADSETISAVHAVITYREGKPGMKEGFYLTDKGSTNRTWVNESEFQADTMLLRHGDRVRLGHYDNLVVVYGLTRE